MTPAPEKQTNNDELEACRILIEEIELSLNQLRIRLSRLAIQASQN